MVIIKTIGAVVISAALLEAVYMMGDKSSNDKYDSCNGQEPWYR